MDDGFVQYPDIVLPRLRYKFCPMCRAQLSSGIISEDNVERVLCPSCGWVHFSGNAVGACVVVTVADDAIVALLPANEPPETPAAVPAGHVEYGESPAEAAVREAREETGLTVEVVRCLGWDFSAKSTYPGPMVNFYFEAKAVGGTLRDGEEGNVRVFPVDQFPAISPSRTGSRTAMRLFRDQRESHRDDTRD